MKILKFGGTSVWSKEMIEKTAKIVVDAKKEDSIIVVVSAMSGITNTLIEICELAKNWKQETFFPLLESIKEKHIQVAQALCNNNCDIFFINEINKYIIQLEDILKWVSLLKQLSDKWKAKILYFWEILSSLLVSLAISQAWYPSKNYFSRDLLICSWKFIDWDCNYKSSEEKINEFIKNIYLSKQIPVITWFWWGDEEGNVYLFDRGGSDYIATLLGRFWQASSVEIWTDVDGIMSADPRIVETPILWEELDYSICAEFAIAGAKVLHPKTISPVQRKAIPVVIKNTFNPKAPWTKICSNKSEWIKGIHIDDNQILLSFIDPAMIGSIWYIAEVVKVFRDLKISLDTIATTETSFTLSLRKKDYTEKLIEELEKIKEFFFLEILENIAKISLIGNNINDYSILENLENIVLISKWAYGKSLTLFVKTSDSKKLLQDLHKKIFQK